MTRSHVLLHCRNLRLVAARTEAWEGRNPGGASQSQVGEAVCSFLGAVWGGEDDG
jgi:hypothetical protein